MDSLKNPVGPEAPSVYWRRRALVIGGVILVIIAIILLWPSGGSSPTSAPASASPSASSARPSGSASASATPSGSASPSSSASGASESASPSSSDSASASGSASPSASGSGGKCATSDLSLVAVPEPKAGAVGGVIKMTMRLTNESSTACSWDVGSKAVTFTVTSGGQRVWSSDDCNPGGSSDLQVVPPGKTFEVTSEWPTVVTQPGCGTQTPAKAGSYDVSVSDDALTSPSARFTLG